MIGEFGIILIFGVVAIIFLLLMLLVSSALRKQKPNQEKLSTYECGEEAIGNIGFGTFNSRYYILAIIFLLFDVELILLFPWAEVFIKLESPVNWNLWAIIELTIFIIVLAIGLSYVWVKGYLDWNEVNSPNKKIVIPVTYQNFNDGL